MKRSYTCPDSFKLTDSDVQWAVDKYRIIPAEVWRQFEMMQENEFKRPYSHWNLVWKRWLRSAEKYELLKREHKPRTIQNMTDQERTDAQRSFDAQILRFGGK